MIDNMDPIVSQIRKCICSGDSSELEKIVNEYASYSFQDDPDYRKFDQHVFDLILEMMAQPAFLNMEGSYYLLRLFEYDWSMLVPSQTDKLLTAIECSYDKYSDWMSCFVLSQLLGKNYCNGKAFQAIIKLNNTSKEIPRSLLPMALEYLAHGNNSDPVLKDKAMLELTRLASDSADRVRQEAIESLDRLTNRGTVQT